MCFDNESVVARLDHFNEIEELVASTQKIQDDLDKSSHLQAKIAAGAASVHVEERYNKLLARKELHDDRLALCRSITKTQTRFGRVIAASGYRKSGKQRLDWALILVNDHRIGENK
ncbi:MAG: hypothetical protein LQ341_007391, partial [Variospora aurantia]